MRGFVDLIAAEIDLRIDAAAYSRSTVVGISAGIGFVGGTIICLVGLPFGPPGWGAAAACAKAVFGTTAGMAAFSYMTRGSKSQYEADEGVYSAEAVKTSLESDYQTTRRAHYEHLKAQLLDFYDRALYLEP